ncbi:MAG: FAD-binding oxidoreductase [Sediminimonas qiaohouensis]|uniref:FAD-binding oxidoreductase n=1 Tax=Sediminimonas qiaohouensis TaxID=552061 RepID=A0A7C9LL36_9RHOB|nr:FAD-binding oxidoreductase [Sediminimonas qiaohouensis]MTJ03260.1 FAD-binding oxidoreductase [Sediminimonas qiaohouensis]
MIWNHLTYSSWGRALAVTGDIARPERISALRALPAAPAIGNRRSYGDACINGAGPVIDMTRLDRLLSFDEDTGVLEAEAGVTLGEITRLMAPRGWLLPVLPGTGFATLGGAIAMDVHGKNHQNAGSFGQHVSAIRLMQKGKARQITAKSAPTLMRATIGGLGQTGVIVSARVQMIPVSGETMQVRESRVTGWDEHIALLDASEATYTVGWLDAGARGAALGRGIVEEGEIGPDPARPPRSPHTVPLTAPHWALSKPIVRAFNALYYRRVPAAGRTVTKRLEDYFFPLDKIHDWNRLYGRRGFHQFQCVVPPEKATALHAMLSRIADSGLASPLAVLKRLGPGRGGMMSFPMEGYTLAVDFPNRARARDLIASLESDVSEAGGRLYLAKDALAAPDTIRAMYPEHADWAAAAAKADPDGALETDMTRRLALRRT